MKEPTGNAEAELIYWQQRAIKAEVSVEQLENDMEYLREELLYARGELANERYNYSSYNDE